MNVIIAFTLLATYTLTVCVVNSGIPASLSQTVFLLPKKGRWLWAFVICASALLMIPTMIDSGSEHTQWLAAIACFGYFTTGVVPIVKDSTDTAYTIHMVGAYTAVVASTLFIMLNGPLTLMSWVPWIAVHAIMLLRHRNWRTATFWAEIISLTSIFIYVHRQL